MRRLSRLLTLAVLLAPAPLLGQYFGQNKVQYTTFDFRVIETEHFDVYYYEEEREAAFDVARMAERSYARLSRILRHQFRERKPIILYASHSDFQQTNTTPARNEPTLATPAWKKRLSGSTRMIEVSTRRGMVTSATTRFPRVRMMLTCEAFLSVAKFDSR